MALNKRQTARVRRLRALLDVADPMFAGSPKIRTLLSDRDARLYFTTWVLPELSHLVGDPPGVVTGEAPPVMPMPDSLERSKTTEARTNTPE